MINSSSLFIIVICIVIIICDFLIWWGIIPKQIDHHKSRGKTILNENKYIKALKKAIIMQIIIYSILIILIVGFLKNLKIYEITFIMTGYLIVRYVVNYKIEKRYIIKNSNTK